MNRLLLPFLPLAVVACGAGEPDPAEMACEMVGHGDPLTAAASREEDSAAVLPSSEHGALVQLTEGETSWVRFEVAEEEHFLLLTDTADVIAGLYQDEGTDDQLPAGTPAEACAEDIPEHYDLELTPGTWHLELGPAAVDQVWISLVGAGEHGH